MKVDVLTIFDSIKVCTQYRLADGTLTDQLPYDLCDEGVEPVYKEFKGWKTSLDGVRDFDAIPAELNAYVKFLEAELNLPITFISTGPDREALISREAAAVA
jgi:adenylosuccinate synthase